MSYVLNDPATFADEFADGFVAANHNVVRRVPGGVARAGATAKGTVAVVIGGGSGHYPAFAGLVGPGLAHGAALGNVFASPSAQQVYSVAKSVAADAGVLLTYGNYAGDVLNFDLAMKRLEDEGISCRSVSVTDDIYSAPLAEKFKRRGVAGDLAVFKTAAWAAERGYSLDDVAAIASRANHRTRTFGVAFSGCTLPGADKPLFTVPVGQMAVGLGIHGEPGLDIRPIPPARELAALFVESLLKEKPDSIDSVAGARVAVILNGLGAVKGEELFVIYSTVAEELARAGIEIVEPDVGEYATSFEMAGVSLTLFWLDEELERAWRSPAYSAGYRKGAADQSGVKAQAVDTASAEDIETVPAASPEAVVAALTAEAVLSAIRDMIDRNVDEFGRLDAIAGDGDHGIGMQRGSRAAASAASAAVVLGAGCGTTLMHAGDAWADKAGGTSGALWGGALRAAGKRLGDQRAPTGADVADAVDEARATIQEYGKAVVGDKTLVDSLVPFAHELGSQVAEGVPLAKAWAAAAVVATDAARATADLVPRLGRARPHGEKSLGTPDPGAISFALAMATAGEILAQHTNSKEKLT